MAGPLDIRNGQVHCLLGENGAGKSTLISILAGMQLPDSGTIEIDGTPVVIGSPKAAMRHGIGVVHQHSTLVPTLTVIENLMLGESGLLLKRKRAMARHDAIVRNERESFVREHCRLGVQAWVARIGSEGH